MQAPDLDLQTRRVEGDVPPIERHRWTTGPLLGLALLAVFVLVVALVA